MFLKPQQGCTAALVALLALVASSFAPTLTLSATTTTTSTFVCTAACAVAAPTTSQCGAENVTNAQFACSASRTTYEGCSKTLCDEVCANVPTPMTAEPETVMSNGKEFHCFNASDYKYMYMAGTKAAAEANAIEHSVAMNCDGGAHDMSSMNMFMSGTTHMACDNWSNAQTTPTSSSSPSLSSARVATTIALALAACALAA
jgi:hypothetical protein